MLLAAALLSIVAAHGSEARGAPALSANGRIAFTDVTGIASMNPDGSGQWGVEWNLGDSTPAWSPDGSQLAVATYWANRFGILVMQPDGSGAHLLTTNAGDHSPAWSPDGTKVALANGPEIDIVSADGSSRTTLTANGQGYAWHPTWSPDGRTIAYAYGSPITYRTSVLLVDAATGAQSTLLSDPKADFSAPAWSPDGGSIAFASTADGPQRIYTVNPDGTGRRALTDGSGWEQDPAWSPDGTQLAFDRAQQIWVMARDGSGAHQLTTGDGNSQPAWQPLGPAPAGCALWGTNGNDLLVGTDGNDTLCGLGGDDTVIGLGGADLLVGGDGNDSLAGGLGGDRLYGGPGNDTLDARDGGADIVDGGPGSDAAFVDGRIDHLFGIERPKIDRNLAIWHPVSTDAFEPSNPPSMAVDGQVGDWWNSGGYPTHWLEVDLQRPVDITRLRVVTPELPTGAAAILLGRTAPTDAFRLLVTIKGPTADLEQLDYAPRHPWRAIRYVRLVVPQAQGYSSPWVSWRELAVYGRR